MKDMLEDRKKQRRSKVLIGGLLTVLFGILLWGAACSGSSEDGGIHAKPPGKIPVKKAGEPLTIWVATDLHYLAEGLTDEGPMFMSTMINGDGKLTERTPEILEAFLEQVLTAQPDALVLSGDLTFNGERQSLQELANQLAAVQEAGIPVLVIPGNHDIDYPLAFSYEGEAMRVVENISMDTFQEICGKFGYDQAVSSDPSSFSYAYKLAEDVQILCLDGNTTEYAGSLSMETMKWAENQLAETQKAGVTVLSVSHQNVLPQNQLLYYGFALYNYEEVAAMLQKYGVKANFSGHSHIQHVSREGDLADYATGPLSVAPLRYGVIHIDEERNISYEMASLAEPVWGATDVKEPWEDHPEIAVSQDVLQLTEEAELRYMDCNRRQVVAALTALQQKGGFTDQELERMADFVLEVNRAYFAGELTGQQEYLASEDWALWTMYGKDDFWWAYLDRILHEEQ